MLSCGSTFDQINNKNSNKTLLHMNTNIQALTSSLYRWFLKASVLVKQHRPLLVTVNMADRSQEKKKDVL